MSILSDLYSLLVPRSCPVCGERLSQGEDFICLACSAQWPRLDIDDVADNAMVRRLWPHFAAVYGASLITYRHHSPFHQILMRIKYQGGAALAEAMGRWGAREFEASPLREWADAVVPVPLSRWRRLRRGYNQAELISRGIAGEYGLPVAKLLRRAEGSTTQTRLSAEQRLENVKGRITAHIPPQWRGKHLLLVDDVMTTGATLTACAQAILADDPQAQISVFTIALAG